MMYVEYSSRELMQSKHASGKAAGGAKDLAGRKRLLGSTLANVLASLGGEKALWGRAWAWAAPPTPQDVFTEGKYYQVSHQS